MKTAVIVFPGSNCDRDAAMALEAVTGVKPAMVWHEEPELPEGLDFVMVPGGFSYGDYLRSGAVAARSPIVADLKKKAEAGVPMLGVCNGFQILTEAGLLPGALLRNAGIEFVCGMRTLRVENTDSPFTKGLKHGQYLKFPVAHHDGNYFADPETLARIEGEGLVAFRYCDGTGVVGGSANPNGSINDIAGIFDPARKVLGLMPHPERLADPALGGTDGQAMFNSLVECLS